MSAEEFVRFWKRLDIEGSPLIHPDDDIPAIELQGDVNTYNDYVRVLGDGALREKALHTSLVPVPYLGDLVNADIVILLLNPGLGPLDYWAEEQSPEFRNHLIASLWQERRTHISLDPEWAWTGGFKWWEEKLRDVGKLIALERFDGNYGRALRSLSERVLAVELVPYHSIKFGASLNLSSMRKAQQFVSSIECDRTVIITRGARHWSVNENPNVVRYSAGQARGASLSKKSPGGQAILRAYGLV